MVMETLSISERELEATLPSIEECKLSSTSSQTVVDSPKLTNTNSQSKSITDCMNCPVSSGKSKIPVSSLHLLVPPLQLLSAAVWKVLQQQDVFHYRKLEEFVSLVTEAFPELLSESQRTELTLGLQFGCKTDPALEVLLWEFLSTLDQLLPVPDLTQTVSWLSAAPSVLEVCAQSVYYPDQLKTLLRHHRSLVQLDMNATLPSIEECKLSSTSCPPSQRVVDSTKLTNTNSQSESITDCMNCLSPASSGEALRQNL
ncbi:hypothetical protein SKAU_G00183380 [Synaphobranchus kaupii]|uniref:TERF1-interacting nuclear factor 2 N-terminal domain-containing protein n=1 Tax=Synaphobranchus kaupii TaxID=118154 RepID=A0A9Q1FC70_SYNKA|nr:hypothetical protein SKAU_G00183380 [Synaphobranchus kaupii]